MEEHVTDLIPAYALGILDEEDRTHVRAHLQSCQTCGQELEHYREVVDRLPLAAPEHLPPPRLKEAIMARAEPRPTRRSWLARLGQSIGAAFQARPAWALASIVLVLALAAGNLLLLGELRGAQQQRTAYTIIHMANTDAAPGATGLLVISPGGEYGALIVDGLPQPPQGKAYQLWLIKDGKRTSGGVFDVMEGYGVMSVGSAVPLNQYNGFGITLEPARGSPGPTGPKVLGST